MQCCPRPKAEKASGNIASGHPQHLVGDSFDCCTERYEIVEYCKHSKNQQRFSHGMMLPSDAVGKANSEKSDQTAP